MMSLMNALSIPIAVAATRRLVEASGPDKPRTRKREAA
jgi:hypothetical protein